MKPQCKNIIVTINVGSSNIKLAVFDQENLQCLGKEHQQDEVKIMKRFGELSKDYKIVNVVHRIVHGGRKFLAPAVLNSQAISELTKLIPLAPLHQLKALKIISKIKFAYPKMKQIGCFDTAFHQTMPPIATMTTLPISYYKKGIQRYGFHGLSYEYIASFMLQNMANKPHKKIVVAHLGSGSSMCAMQDLKSIATTMGFSPLDGLMMATRTGSIDPGILLYMTKTLKISPSKLENILYYDSGLRGVSGRVSGGVSGGVSAIDFDVKNLLASTDVEAKKAVELYCYIAAKNLGSLITLLGGIDALIFTGGIGENCPLIRQLIGEYIGWLGLKINKNQNESNGLLISSKTSKIEVLAIPTNEELILAKAGQQIIISY